jgi:hypothetical protein
MSGEGRLFDIEVILPFGFVDIVRDPGKTVRSWEGGPSHERETRPSGGL